MKHVKIIVEKHPDGYVAYPLGVKGVVVGQGDSYEEALSDVQSVLAFHIETFGSDVLETAIPIFHRSDCKISAIACSTRKHGTN